MKTILFPGWASFKTFYKKEVLEEFFYLEEISGENEVNVIAWSMGSLRALDYIKTHKVNKLILLAPTTDFTKTTSAEIINQMISGIGVNKEITLKNFYKMNFSDMVDFRKFWDLYKEEIDKLSKEELVKGLEFLRDFKIESPDFSNVKEVHVVLGEKDRIIPLENNREFLNIGKTYNFQKGHNLLYNNDELKALVRSILSD